MGLPTALGSDGFAVRVSLGVAQLVKMLATKPGAPSLIPESACWREMVPAGCPLPSMRALWIYPITETVNNVAGSVAQTLAYITSTMENQVLWHMPVIPASRERRSGV